MRNLATILLVSCPAVRSEAGQPLAFSWLGAEILEAIKYQERSNAPIASIAANVSNYFTPESNLQQAIDLVAADLKLNQPANVSLGYLKDLLQRRAALVDYDVTFLDTKMEGEAAKQAAYKLFQVAKEIAAFSFDPVPAKIASVRLNLREIKVKLATFPKGWDQDEGKLKQVYIATMAPLMIKLKVSVNNIVRVSAVSWVGAEILDILDSDFRRANLTRAVVEVNKTINVPNTWVSNESLQLWGWAHPVMRIAQKVASRVSSEVAINNLLDEIRQHVKDARTVLFSEKCRAAKCASNDEVIHVMTHLVELRELLQWRTALYGSVRDSLKVILKKSEMLSKGMFRGCSLLDRWTPFHSEVTDKFAAVNRLKYREPVPDTKKALSKKMDEWAILGTNASLALPGSVEACLGMSLSDIEIVRNTLYVQLSGLTSAVQAMLLPDNLPL